MHPAIELPSILLHYLAIWPAAGYILAFLFLVFEGDAPLFIFGFLTEQGYFDPVLMFVVTYVGTLIGDMVFYYFGVFSARWPIVAKWADTIAAPFDSHLRDHPFRTLFLSEFAYGIHHALWVRAGNLGLPVKKLAKIDALISVPWVLIVGGLGYAASATLLPLGRYLRNAEITLLLGIIILVVFQHYMKRFAKKKL